MKTGQWTKIGEVKKHKGGNPFSLKASNAIYAVFEMVCDSGIRKYKEVYMASDDYQYPILNTNP